MPLAKPKKGESKEQFVSRCYGDSNTVKEFPDAKQRGGYCYTAWKQKKAKASYVITVGSDEFIYTLDDQETEEDNAKSS